MGHNGLEPFFNPRSIAVIGASEKPGSFGYEIMRNLLARYKGRVYPVNPNYSEILGLKAYTSISSIDEEVDLAVVAVRAEVVPEVLHEAGEVGVRASIIVSGGFSESGPEGRILEERVRRIASSYGIRVIGPNCIGVYDAVTGVDTFFLPRERMRRPPKGQVVLIGQSGALLTMLMDLASTMNLGVYRAVNLGNRVDVGEEEILDYLVGDEYARVVGLYIEGLRRMQGVRLMESIDSIVRAGKSVVVLKGGRGQQGARAAYSHTASLAGDYEVFKAAMEQAGAIVVEDPLDMLDALKALALLRPPRGNKVGVVTNAGGPGVVAVDALSSYGLEVPRLDEDSMVNLRSTFPRIVSVENPVDLTGGARVQDYSRTLEVLLGSNAIDMILVIAPVQPATLTDSIADVIAGAAFKGKDKPLVAVMIGADYGEMLSQYLENLGVPVYKLPTRAAYALHVLWLRYRGRCGYKGAYTNIINSMDGSSLVKTPDHKALGIASRYGIEVPGYCLAATREEVGECFHRLEKPLVAKVSSPDIVHKTDVGGVVTGINTVEEALAAYDAVTARVSKARPRARIDGILYQEMVTGEGLELIIGGRRDPAFGTVILFGMGGFGVEILKDYTMRIAPVTECHANEMIGEVRVGALIRGYRGKPPLHKDGIIKAITSISRLLEENPQIAEAEINPLIATKDKAVAVDVRILETR